jgi:pimeloyl-ACP methyl ester carboxylesterase
VFFQDLLKSPLITNLPIKVIGGEDDLLFSPEVIQFTASYYSLRAEILSGLGHMIPIESNYQKGINAIDSFLNEVY